MNVRKKSIWPVILNHAGLLVVTVCMAFGSGDFQQLYMTVYEGTTQYQAIDGKGSIVEPGFSIELHDFSVEYYPGNSPKRFASHISVNTKDNHVVEEILEVNKPVKVDGWSIYQYGYNTLMLVRDPWLPGVYFGFFLLLAGAIAMLCTLDFKISGTRGVLLFSGILLLTAVFLYYFTPVFKTGHPAPALQSPWFSPHVIVYMLSYALLAAATLLALLHKENLTDNLIRAGVAFFTIGMLCGAFWAKQAWGHYWTWDPKETWAAITWGCYLLY
ncbi:MAG: cytochrome c biogenesis protein CcsA, partial [Bacteroidales bacterium]|nr:cytochrome c biogenesis protein CcsA [Bacteroidales bacterium]